MIFATILVIFVDARDAGDPSTAALARTAETALGQGSTVTVVDRGEHTTPRELEALAPNDAGALVDVRWTSDSREQARIRLRRDHAAPWIERTIAFEAFDRPAERGRAVAYAITAMLASSAPPPEVPAETAPRPSTIPTTPAPARDAATSVTSPSNSHAAERPPWGGLVATGLAAVDVAGSGTVFGGALAFEWNPAPRVALRTGLTLRTGRVDQAQASVAEVGLVAGVRYELVPTTPERRFGIGARLDVLALYQSLSHFSSDDSEPVHQSRWVPAGVAVLDASWAFSSGGTSIVAGAGAEVLAGKLDVFTHLHDVAHLSPFRAIGEVGLRSKF